MRLEKFLQSSVQRLSDAGISTARLDCLVLLEDSTGKDRAHLLAHPELELTNEQIRSLNEQLMRRMEHVPLAYIRGKTEFYGREFYVNEYVLEPRPETETMIELLKRCTQNMAPNAIIDVGTGSGALAITAKLELPKVQAIAIDIDKNCLELAAKNAAKLGADIEPLQGNLMAPVIGRDLQSYALLCNLPYVPENFHINQAATHEPRLAIFGGPDGLDPYRNLFTQLDGLPVKPQLVFTEALPPQHEELADIAEQHGYTVSESEDFIQVFMPKA